MVVGTPGLDAWLPGIPNPLNWPQGKTGAAPRAGGLQPMAAIALRGADQYKSIKRFRG